MQNYKLRYFLRKYIFIHPQSGYRNFAFIILHFALQIVNFYDLGGSFQQNGGHGIAFAVDDDF